MWISAFAGIALTGAYAPLSWFPLAVLAPAVTLALWRRAPRVAAARGWVFGFAHFGTSFYWLYYSLHDFGQAPVVLAVAATMLFSAVLAVYCAGLAWVTAHVAREDGQGVVMPGRVSVSVGIERMVKRRFADRVSMELHRAGGD